MAILHVYDNNGQEVTIPAIKGATGDTGPQGKSAY